MQFHADTSMHARFCAGPGAGPARLVRGYDPGRVPAALARAGARQRELTE